MITIEEIIDKLEMANKSLSELESVGNFLGNLTVGDMPVMKRTERIVELLNVLAELFNDETMRHLAVDMALKLVTIEKANLKKE